MKKKRPGDGARHGHGVRADQAAPVRVHLVLSDVVMPRTSGRHLHEAIRVELADSVRDVPDHGGKKSA